MGCSKASALVLTLALCVYCGDGGASKRHTGCYGAGTFGRSGYSRSLGIQLTDLRIRGGSDDVGMNGDHGRQSASEGPREMMFVDDEADEEQEIELEEAARRLQQHLFELRREEQVIEVEESRGRRLAPDDPHRRVDQDDMEDGSSSISAVLRSPSSLEDGNERLRSDTETNTQAEEGIDQRQGDGIPRYGRAEVLRQAIRGLEALSASVGRQRGEDTEFSREAANVLSSMSSLSSRTSRLEGLVLREDAHMGGRLLHTDRRWVVLNGSPSACRRLRR